MISEFRVPAFLDHASQSGEGANKTIPIWRERNERMNRAQQRAGSLSRGNLNGRRIARPVG